MIASIWKCNARAIQIGALLFQISFSLYRSGRFVTQTRSQMNRLARMKLLLRENSKG